MAKYSINSDDKDDEDSESAGNVCELCGAESENLNRAKISGAKLDVCSNCSPHNDNKNDESGSRDESEENRTKRAIRRANRHTHRQDSEWAEEGTDYDSDPLPYLVDNYARKIVEERQEQDMNEGELADKAGMGLRDLRMIERGEATRGDIGKSEIKAIEQVLEIEIIEEI